MSSTCSPLSSCTYAKARSSAADAATGDQPTELTLPPYATPAKSTAATQTIKATHSSSTDHSAVATQHLASAPEGLPADAADAAAARAERGEDGGRGEADMQGAARRRRNNAARRRHAAAAF